MRDVVQKAHSGSYLLREPERMGVIIERVVKACAPTPVTAKIRLGCSRNKINAIDMAQVVEGAGAAALTVHGRTAADMFRGSADWDRIAAIKPHLKRIPLIGNGDLDSARKVVDAFRRYDVDGVMIARASLAKPWLFRQAAAALRGEPVPPDPTLAEERQLLLHHFDLICQRFGDAKGTLLMRKYACCYAQGRAGAREFRSRVVKVSTPAEFRRRRRRLVSRDAAAEGPRSAHCAVRVERRQCRVIRSPVASVRYWRKALSTVKVFMTITHLFFKYWVVKNSRNP